MSLSFQQQKDILDHTYDLLTQFNSGVPPKGSVAPWWETSSEGSTLLLEKGIEYGMPLQQSSILRLTVFLPDHSDMAHEYAVTANGYFREHAQTIVHSSQAYYLRDEDTWTKISYKSEAHSWMKPLQRGKETGLVEIPANWYLDDLRL